MRPQQPQFCFSVSLCLPQIPSYGAVSIDRSFGSRTDQMIR